MLPLAADENFNAVIIRGGWPKVCRTGETLMAFPVDRSWIASAEQTLGRRLPASYVAFLQHSNGGHTPDDRWLLHPVADASDRQRLKRTANDILRETDKARGHRGFPDGAVVIGENLENTLLVLLPDPNDASRYLSAVYAWHPFHRELTEVVSDFSRLTASP